jgi:Flp pilus assembly protein TadG
MSADPHRKSRNLALRSTWVSGRRATVTLMFAITLIPLTMLIGMAIDFAWVMQTRAQLNLAADSAAIAAARQAAAIYAQGYTYTNPNSPTLATNIPIQFGQSAASQWWNAQTSRISQATNLVMTPTVTQNGQNFSSKVVWSADVNEILPNLLKSTLGYSTAGNTSVATVTVNEYGAIDLLLDNTSSMMLAVDSTNQQKLQTAIFSWLTNPTYAAANILNVNTNANGLGLISSDGQTAIPGGAATLILGGLTSANACTFACHWSSTGNTTSQLDYYWVARGAGVTLRFDTVNAAAVQAIDSMKTMEATSGQLSLGVYSFGGTLSGSSAPAYTPYFKTVFTEAAIDQLVNGVMTNGYGANLAEAAVNAMTPPISGDVPETNFSYAINGLLNVSTIAASVPGNLGGTPATAKRSVIIVTDGIEDDNPIQSIPSTEGPITPSICNGLKNKGITVYVLYTTYLSQSIDLPFGNSALAPYITGSASNDLLPALTSCASSPEDLIQATSQSDIQSAMATLVELAVANSIRFVD